MRSSITAIAAVTVLISLGFSEAASAQEHKTFKIHQAVPVLVTVDVGDPGSSHGDILAFEASLTGDGGSTGMLRGLLTTVDIPDGDDMLEDRVGQLVFDMGDGSMLIVAGTSVYPNQSVEMAGKTPQTRAVVGGTGSFIGARGQVTTVRNDDGSYEHSFELLD